MHGWRLTRFADNTFQIVVFAMLLGLVAAAGWYTYTAEQVANHSYSTVVNAVSGSAQAPQTFNECVAQSGVIVQSSPEVCITQAGKRFTQSQ